MALLYMADHCIPNTSRVNTSIYIVLHVTILFMILSTFFIVYVSKVVKSTVEDEMHTLIQNNLTNSLTDLPLPAQVALKEGIRNLPTDALLRYYSPEDPRTQTYNQWLFRAVIIVNVFLLIVTIGTLTIANTMCAHVPFKHMLIENVIIFAMIGVIELSFFKFIAIKYIPAPPSYMIQAIIDGLQKNI